MLPQHTTSSGKRSFVVILGAVFSLGIGVLALLLAVGGFLGRGGAADIASALPNLITGLASIAGAVGYLALKKWAVPVYAIAVIGHFVAHTLLFVSRRGSGHASVAGMVFLWAIPILALLVLISMEQQRRRGVLT